MKRILKLFLTFVALTGFTITVYLFGWVFNYHLEEALTLEIRKLAKVTQETNMLYKSTFNCSFKKEEGIASWYGKPFHGRITSNGEVYDMHKISAAHKHLPHGTLVLVVNQANNKRILVRINDRGPFIEGRIIDLSYAAFQKIADPKKGLADVKIFTVIKKEKV